MPAVRKEGDIQYVELLDNDASIAMKDGSIMEFPVVGGVPNKTYAATLNVSFNRIFSYATRGLCRTKLDLGLGLGTTISSQAFFDGIMSAPVPMSGKWDPLPSDPPAPQTLKTDMGMEFDFDLSTQVRNGGLFIFKMTVDMMRIKVELYDITDGGKLELDKPTVFSSQFRLSVLAEDDESLVDGSPEPSEEPLLLGSSTEQDAAVVKITRSVEMSMVDTLYAELMRAGGHMKQKLRTGYGKLYSAFDSLDSGGGGFDPSGKLMVRYGVDMNGTGMKVINLEGSTARRFLGGIETFFPKQTFEVDYYYGDVLYPANPHFGNMRRAFDIITDSEYWTDNGPTVGEYEQGSGGGCNFIFSWEGRSSIGPVQITRAAAGLPKHD